MTTSTKRKKEKKKDFQKAKLKVGRTKPKGDNFTSTAFSSKTISLKKQSISTAAPSAKSQVTHHLSLLRNRSDTQRLESLAYLTNLPTPELGLFLLDILPKLPPLIHDPSSRVRNQLLRLLKHIPPTALTVQHEHLLLWTRAAMTHLSSDIRSFSIDVLELLINVAGDDIVSCKGGWVLTLRCFVTLLGWKKTIGAAGWSNLGKSKSVTGEEAKILAKQLNALAAFIRAGIEPPTADGISAWTIDQKAEAAREFPFLQIKQHQIPKRRNPYAHLDLFGENNRNEEDVVLEDREERLQAFTDKFLPDIRLGIDEAKKQGGEVGRAAATLSRAVEMATT